MGAEVSEKRSPTIRREPVIFMRHRQSGVSNVFDLILEDIANRVDFPAALLQIVGFAAAVQNDPRDRSIFVVSWQ